MKISKNIQVGVLVVAGLAIIIGTVVIIKKLSTFSVLSINEQERQTLNDSVAEKQRMNDAIKELKTETLSEGTGDGAKAGDVLTMNYTGTLVDGTKFDSSLDAGRSAFQFTLGKGEVIKGWDEGIAGMKVGEKRKLTIPPSLGYGAQGAGSVIPPNAALIFTVELLKIN